MTPEETIHQLLGLGQSQKVMRTGYEADNNKLVICVVEETEALWAEESQKRDKRSDVTTMSSRCGGGI